ncbi:MAG: hypoxanthine phosphoribosyltransferase [Bacillota bacterium]|nr:hypoxanthine phosphoribosyltransferase [Bacillota bacterium]
MKKDNLKIIYDEETIAKRVDALAKEITRDYDGKDLLAIGILKGSFMFFSDLLKKIDLPLEIDFMVAKSYGDNTHPGEVRIMKDLDKPIEGRHVLIVEDILDTGQTLNALYKLLEVRGAASIKTCTFLDKPARRNTDFYADYKGYEIPDFFAVGYGLDCAEKYRNLPYIAELITEDK